MSLVHNTLTPDIETSSEDYARRFEGGIGAYFLGVQERAVTAMLAQVGAGSLRVLELGGGHAQLTAALAAAGHSVAVQGSAQEALQRCAPLLGKYKGLSTIVSSLWDVPQPDRAFDVVIAVRLLAHVERWPELLGEMARLANRALIVDFAVKGGLNRLTPALFGLKRRIEGNTRPYFSYSGRELQAVLGKLGFEVCAERRQFFFPMGLHRGLKSPRISRILEGGAAGLGLTRLFGSPAITLYMRSPKSL